jgi:hypothetical protein
MMKARDIVELAVAITALFIGLDLGAWIASKIGI